MRRFLSVATTFGLVSMLSASIALACSSPPEPTPTPQPTAVVQPSPTPTPVPLEPDEVIANAIDSLVDAGSIWFLLEHENGFTEALGGLELTRVEGAITETGMSISRRSQSRTYLHRSRCGPDRHQHVVDESANW